MCENEQEASRTTADPDCLLLTFLMPSGNRKVIITQWQTSRSASNEKFIQAYVYVYHILAFLTTNHPSNISTFISMSLPDIASNISIFLKKHQKKNHTTFPFLFKVKFFRDKSGLNYYVKLCHKFGDVLYEMMM